MKVSVLLLSYNQAEFVAKAIQSVVSQQTSFSFELLISDDCSTDGSREIILDFQNRYPQIIRSFFQEENLGPKNNDYFIFQQSKGEYICYCEADDFWCDDLKLQKQVSFLEANPDYGLVHGDANYLYLDTNKYIASYNKSESIQVASGEIYEKVMLGNHYIKTMTACFRKDLINRYYFTDDYITGSNWMMVDLSLWLCISYHSKIKYFEDTFSTYCLREESMSRSKSPRKLHHFHLDIFDIRFHFIRKYGCLLESQNAINLGYIKMLIGDAFQLNDLSILKKSIQFIRLKGVFIGAKNWMLIFLVFCKSLVLPTKN
jgi:glycosyltransferase involved in cell wall biosynthesis